jgi:hypothetical protein
METSHRAEIEDSVRSRSVNRCPQCNEVPQETDGTLTCACKGKTWLYVQGQKGTEVEEKYLADNGCCYAEDVRGDKYYVASWGAIVHLYPGNRWDCDAAPKTCATLEEYFAWVRSVGE